MDRNVIDYAVVETVSLEKFVESVKQSLASGWQPLGGIVCEGRCYTQAMIKYAPMGARISTGPG